MSKKECPYCGEVGSYPNRGFKAAGKRRCKNGKCRVMVYNEEARKGEQIGDAMKKFKDAAEDFGEDIPDGKLEEIQEKMK